MSTSSAANNPARSYADSACFIDTCGHSKKQLASLSPCVPLHDLITHLARIRANKGDLADLISEFDETLKNGNLTGLDLTLQRSRCALVKLIQKDERLSSTKGSEDEEMRFMRSGTAHTRIFQCRSDARNNGTDSSQCETHDKEHDICEGEASRLFYDDPATAVKLRAKYDPTRSVAQPLIDGLSALAGRLGF